MAGWVMSQGRGITMKDEEKGGRGSEGCVGRGSLGFEIVLLAFQEEGYFSRSCRSEDTCLTIGFLPFSRACTRYCVSFGGLSVLHYF